MLLKDYGVRFEWYRWTDQPRAQYDLIGNFYASDWAVLCNQIVEYSPISILHCLANGRWSDTIFIKSIADAVMFRHNIKLIAKLAKTRSTYELIGL